jgi:hypothetical protein
MKIKRYQLAVAGELSEAALKAHKGGHYLESGIVTFQIIEAYLRIAIITYAKARGMPTSTVKAIDNEQSFHRLVVFYSLLRPKDDISKRLFALNKKRNSLVHKIFIDFKSPKSLKIVLRNFSAEAIEISWKLNKLLLRN